MTQAQINLSENKYSETYFKNLVENPSDYFIKLRRMYVQKEINRFDGLENFMNDSKMFRAAQSNQINVELQQRKGYKLAIFTIKN